MPTTVRTPAGKITFFRREILADVGGRIEAAMRKTVYLIENRVKVLQTGQRSGRWYRIGKTPTKANKAMGMRYRAYQASAPGEPPAIKSSRLLHSVTSRVEPMLTAGGGLGWKGSVGTNVPYAPHLEFGVKGGASQPHVTRRTYRLTKTREHTGEQGVIVRVQRTVKSVRTDLLEGPMPAGGWRLAPRPLWKRAMVELIGQIKGIWSAAAKK